MNERHHFVIAPRSLILVLVVTAASGLRSLAADDDRASGVTPFPTSSRAEFDGVPLQLGSSSGRSLNTLIMKNGQRVSIPVRMRGVRRMVLLHTAVRLADVAQGRIAIKYEGADEPVERRWILRDWQARSATPPDATVVSGFWWYRRDKGLVTDDANAKVYAERVEMDSTRRVESIELAVPKLHRAEFRIYAISVLLSKSDAWAPIDLTEHFNADTILAEDTPPGDENMYLATREAATLALADPREITRSNPDIIVYDPTGGRPRPWKEVPRFNEHFFVLPLRPEKMIAFWTSETHEIRYAFSGDDGTSWSPAELLTQNGAWQVPILSPSGKLYVCNTDGAIKGGFNWVTSTDGGKTWSAPIRRKFARSQIDHPDESVEPRWISPTVPFWDVKRRPIVAYTLWASRKDLPGGTGPAGFCEIQLFRINNLDADPAVEDLEIEWLNRERPVRVPNPDASGASFAQEPYMVALPDGRIFMVMRTNRGEVWYTVSRDGGSSWRDPEPMRYYDGGPILKNPVCPAPVFRLERGDYVLLFNNNDGFVYGSTKRWGQLNRRPAFLCRGEFREDAHQPIWWSDPVLFIDNAGKPFRGRLEAAPYVSITEIAGRRVLWYPDRKAFLLGKILPDSWLDQMKVPAP
jgi:hypothetical protein